MNDLIIRAIKPILESMLDKVAAGAPGAIEALVSRIIATISTSHEPVIAVCTSWYTKLAASATTWLPTTCPRVTSMAIASITFVRVKLDKF